METKGTSKITSLLQKMTAYQEDLVQDNSSTLAIRDKAEETEKKKAKPIDEKYIFVKLRKLLDIPKKFSFCNVEIEAKKFIDDITKKIDEEISKNIKLNYQKADEIKKGIQSIFYREEKLELDSFFLNVPGKNILRFFRNIEDFSFPSLDQKIFENEIYTVIVESTRSLNSTSVKKTKKLRKYYLFFSSLDKYICDYKEYLGNFYESFIKNILQHKNESFDTIKTDFQLSRNFVILILTDNRMDIFRNTMSKIKKNESPESIKNSVKKCFPYIFGKEYKNEINENDILMQKDYKKVLNENVENIKYLVNEINQQKNWTVKVIYFDNYLDMIIPNDDISTELKGIKEHFKHFNEEIFNLKLKSQFLENKLDVLISFSMKYLDNKDLAIITEKLEIENKKIMEIKKNQMLELENENKKDLVKKMENNQEKKEEI